MARHPAALSVQPRRHAGAVLGTGRSDPERIEHPIFAVQQVRRQRRRPDFATEFEIAIGSGADQSKVDELFAKIDSNGDGSIRPEEMQSVMQEAHAGHHHHHHHHASGAGSADPLQALLSDASADGTTSQTTTNSNGSTTITLTYADGTKIDMTTPVSRPMQAQTAPQAIQTLWASPAR
jgi:hypothetical protein